MTVSESFGLPARAIGRMGLLHPSLLLIAESQHVLSWLEVANNLPTTLYGVSPC